MRSHYSRSPSPHALSTSTAAESLLRRGDAVIAGFVAEDGETADLGRAGALVDHRAIADRILDGVMLPGRKGWGYQTHKSRPAATYDFMGATPSSEWPLPMEALGGSIGEKHWSTLSPATLTTLVQRKQKGAHLLPRAVVEQIVVMAVM